MNKLKFNKFLYRYSVIPAALVVATNMIFFYALRGVYIGNRHDVLTSLDKAIPFVPAFIYIYFLAFLQWVICYLVLMVENKEKALYFLTGASITNFICGIIFITFPTFMSIRPEITGSGFTNAFIRFIFSADNPPVNLLPSIHCFESWMCARQIFKSKKVPMWVKISNFIFTLFVFASVLLVKQHAIVDIPAGILVAEIGLLIVRLTKLDKKFMKLEEKIFGLKGE